METDVLHVVADGELARRIAGPPDGGAQPAEAELYRRFAPRVRLYGRRHLRDEAAAQDLAQDVLLIAIERLRAGAVRNPDEIGSFILSTARLTATTRKRTDTRRTRLGDQLPVTEAIDADFVDAVDLPRMAQCLNTLEAHARQVIVLTYYAERNAAQIAEELGSTGGAIRIARHRAMERLRDCMGFRRAA
ncbi:MAG TPA: sigma-70 family RNA polymerase sigma factor [Vicinamibacterales bacterium]|jgi:RNA polymerase sigma-70 factor (ECF subfamily)|nr:sigma-70 family RNA polymerase sigma factor [Vicinamibacterales bacterium]